MRSKESKIIVFEGISGSGKSTIIDLVKQELRIVNIENWFDNPYTRTAMDVIEQNIPFNHDIWTCLYYLDFIGKYHYHLKELFDEGKIILFHRYLYTPLVHDKVRKASPELVNTLYSYSEIREADLIIYLDASPEEALKRIKKSRKPTFYECGLDVRFEENVIDAKRKYNSDEYSEEFLGMSFIEFQEKVRQEYKRILKYKSNVVFLPESLSLDEKKKIVINAINKLES